VRLHNDSIIGQIAAVTNRLLMISDKWYAKLSLLHVFISEIIYVSFQPSVFAAHHWECQNWNNLLTVNLWSPDKITATDMLCTYVHTQQVRFKGSKRLDLGIL
jgi:hypothetical protein